MKKRNITGKLKTYMLAALALVALVGCGQETEIDYSIEGVTQEATESENMENPGGKSGLAQFEEEESWKDTWTVKSGEEEQGVEQTTEVQVTAKIALPNVKQMSVVEVTEPEFDAAFKERVAENLFDAGEIYYGDAARLPKQELQEGTWIDGDLWVVEDIMRENQEWLAARENMENANDFYTPVEDYTVNRYIGKYDERMYTLIFIESAENTDSRRMKQIYWTVNDISEVFPEKFKEQALVDCSPWTLGDWVENECELSEEDALKEAEAFVEQLGFDYSVLSHTYPLLWENLLEKPLEYTEETSESDTWDVNGYVFCFDLGVDDISFVDFGVENEYDSFLFEQDSKDLQYSLRAELQVYVTDSGIIRMVADNPVEITGISEDVALLPLDTIKGIMQETVEEQWESIRTLGSNTYSSNFDTMELIYFRIRDKEHPGDYNYVPTWRLANVTKSITSREMSIMNQVLINAIDGSVIDFFDET